MPTASQSAAGFSFLCLAGAGAWLVMSEFQIADPGRPTTSAAAMRILEAAVPSIADFSAFDVNDENPFIPYNLRQIEITTKRTPPQPAGRTPTKPAGAPVVDEPAKPALPRLAAPGSTGPAATGILISKDGPQAMLTFPGEKNARVMKPGETVNGWTLVAVEGGNVARVKQDASGAVLNLVIPEDLLPVKVKKAEPKPDAKGKGAKDAKEPASPQGKDAKDQAGKPPAPATDGKPAQEPQAAPEPKLPPRPDKLM